MLRVRRVRQQPGWRATPRPARGLRPRGPSARGARPATPARRSPGAAAAMDAVAAAAAGGAAAPPPALPEPRVMLATTEADLSAIATEAAQRRSLGMQGKVREAAERGAAVARAAADAYARVAAANGGVAEVDLRAEEILHAFLLACEARTNRLIALGLQGLQRLVSYDQVQLGQMPTIVSAVHAHAQSTDDTVQLKVLQTVLTLLQSAAVVPSDAEGTSAVLSICLRLFSNTRTAPNVASTAGATLRQAVGFVFEHATSECGLTIAPAQRKGVTASEQGTAVSPEPSTPTPAMAPDADEETATATALLLFADLCTLAGGGSPSWLSSPPVPRSFALEILEFILATRADIFMRVDAFNKLLRERVVSLVMVSLNATSTRSAGSATDEAVATHRLLTQTVATITKKFFTLLPTECMVFLTSLLQGTSPSMPLWQRLCALDALRAAVGDFATVGRFAAQYATDERGTNLVASIASAAAREVHALPLDEPLIMDPLHSLFAGVAKGVELTAEVEAAAAAENTNSGGANGGMSLAECEARGLAIAIDTLCSLCRSCEALADATTSTTVDREGSAAGVREDASPPPPCSRDVAAATLAELAFTLLPPLKDLLTAATGESLILEILKAYQAFTQAAGVLGQIEARDAFLASLCGFTMASRSRARSRETGDAATPLPQRQSSGVEVILAAATAELGLSSSPPDDPHPKYAHVTVPEDAGVVLTLRNVQALRTLFNIAHRLADFLGPSWVLVLQTLWALERTLNSPHATTQEEGSRGADLDVLLASSSMLFTATSHLSDEAVAALFDALMTVSEQEMQEAKLQGDERDSQASVSASPAAGEGVGSPQASTPAAGGKAGGGASKGIMLFSIPHMIDLAIHSASARQEQMWPKLADHLVSAGGSEISGVRQSVADQLERAVSTLLQQAPAGKFEETIARTLRMVYAAGEHPEAQQSGGAVRRAAVLRACLRSLEESGASLTSGWKEILPLITAVAAEEDPAALQPAFACARLIVSDLLVSMPEQHTDEAVQCLAAFASQDTDLNVALTAVGLLWSAADALVARADGRAAAGDANGVGRTPVKLDATGGFGSNSTAASSAKGESDAVAAALLPVLARLDSISTDSRPEVRNASLRTLVRALAANGASLPRMGWDRALNGVLLPLVARVREAAAAASTTEEAAKELSAGRVMLVHHSRNSASKQWDETLTLALSGLARIMRSHMAQLAAHAGGNVGSKRIAGDSRAAHAPAVVTWAFFVDFVLTAFREGSREVASAASASVVTVLGGHPELAVSTGIWEDGIDALSSMVDFACIAATNSTSEHVPHVGSRTGLAGALGELCAKCKASGATGVAADVTPVLNMLDRLVRFPLAAGAADGPQGMAGDLPAVQRAALSSLAGIAPTADAQWRTLIKLLSEYVQADRERTGPGDDAHSSGGAATAWGGGAQSQAFVRAACGTLSDIYTQSAPAPARASMLAAVAAALGSRLRESGNSQLTEGATSGAPETWTLSAHTLVSCAREGVAAASASSAHPMGGRQAWPALAAAFDALLSRPLATTLGGPDGHSESIDAEACRVIGGVVAPACPDREPLDKLATTLGRTWATRAAALDEAPAGVAISPDGEDALLRVATVAMRQLFSLAGGVAGPRAAMAALPQVLGNCDGMLRSYGRASRRVDGVSAPSSARTELVTSMLDALASLTIQPDVAQEVAADGLAVARAARGARARGGGSIVGALVAGSDTFATGADEADPAAPGHTQLLLLYGPLVACVGCEDRTIADKTRELLFMLGNELGLPT